MNRAAPLRFAFLICVQSAALKDTPALRTHALLPRIRCAPSRGADSCPRASCGPLPAGSIQSPRGVGRDRHTRWAKHVPQDQRTNQKETELKHHVQQSHFHRLASGRNAEAKTAQNNKEITSSSTSQPRKAGRMTKATTRTAPNGIASMPGVISPNLPKRYRRGNSLPSKGHFGIASTKRKSTA